jgi:hypothetical protein
LVATYYQLRKRYVMADSLASQQVNGVEKASFALRMSVMRSAASMNDSTICQPTVEHFERALEDDNFPRGMDQAYSSLIPPSARRTN